MSGPTPGSQQAVDRGCTCPVLDNNHGKGIYTGPDSRPNFWITPGCKVHTKGEE